MPESPGPELTCNGTLPCLYLSENLCSALRAGTCPHLPGIPLWMTKVINLHTQLEALASCPEGPDLFYHELFVDCLGTAKST